MSGLARMLGALGATCTGTDRKVSPVTRALIESGIPVDTQQDGSTIPGTCHTVICSAAIPADHPERLAAEARGLEILDYAEALGRVQADRTAVCIAGTHGKSTTAAMLGHVLETCGLDPGFIIGASGPGIGTGSRVGAERIPGSGPLAGRRGILVSEACEFDRSFHHHRPTLALVNNVEEDHLDVYGSLEAVIEAFAEFARRLPDHDRGGVLLIAHEGAHRHRIEPGLRCAIETFGFDPEADHQVVYDPAVRRVGILQQGHWVIQWTNTIPGAHNALNAAAACILAHRLGADWDEIAEAMGTFPGLHRRMERLGARSVDGGSVVVYDDYGHHPTEIEKTLKALRTAEDPARLVCVFQPHQHSRTRFLLEQFARSFVHADEVIVPRIHFVRDTEAERRRISAQDLVDRLLKQGVSAVHMPSFDEIVEHLRSSSRLGDLVVIMGAGPVGTIARDFLDAPP